MRKSRTFAVSLPKFETVTFLWMVEPQNKDKPGSLEWLTHQWNGMEKEEDAVIALLVAAGLTVRFYDPEERQWMDQSRMYGLVRAPGYRDGTWGVPTLSEFQESYLKVV